MGRAPHGNPYLPKTLHKYERRARDAGLTPVPMIELCETVV
jgi:hypothetical protein